ncbi:hypothetical protein FOZ63_027931 [Perkinsus olseni]|uniref:Uncharacterized protein n=1 Tax=Perkinsus olseni TaxID=32597 RepID=A0A7J6T2G8_PEROL|nr:hypothetical protein FOZ63_027931 [Perkinsus olseni]
MKMTLEWLLSLIASVLAMDGLDSSGLSSSHHHHRAWVAEGWAEVTDDGISLVQLEASGPVESVSLQESVTLMKVPDRSLHSPRQCPLTGESPGDRMVPSEGSCAYWTRGVCCTEGQLLAVDEVLSHALAFVHDAPTSKLGQCPGCRENIHALLCGLVCSPDVLEKSPTGELEVVLPAAFCESLRGSCGMGGETSTGANSESTCDIGPEAKAIVETLLGRVSSSATRVATVSVDHNKKHSILAVSTSCEGDDFTKLAAFKNDQQLIKPEGDELKQHTGGAPEKHTHDDAARRGRTIAAMMYAAAGFILFVACLALWMTFERRRDPRISMKTRWRGKPTQKAEGEQEPRTSIKLE